MNELALFAGAGGGILASQLLNNRIVCAVEREPYRQGVLVQRQNDGILSPFPLWDDVRTFDGNRWKGVVDLVSGGFPCQAFSTAARGQNIKEKDLWDEMLRIVSEVMPTFVFAENVQESPILKACKDMETLGYSCVYTKLSATDLGADHIRTRYWALAYSNNNGQLLCSEYAKAQGLQKLQNDIWKCNALKYGVPDGLASRMERNRAIGDGQVPIVAATAWTQLITAMYEEN